MTKRDRMLLLIMGIVLIFFLPYYFLGQDLLNENAALKATKAMLTESKAAFEERRDGLESRYAHVESLTNEFDDYTEGLLVNMAKTYDAHYVFVNLAERNGLKILSLSIEESFGVMSKDEIGGANTHKQTVTLQLSGTLSSVMSLIEDIDAESPSFIVESLIVPDITNPSQVIATLKTGAFGVVKSEVAQ